MWPLPGIRRAFRLALRRRAAADLDEEIAFHLDLRAREFMARGWDATAAREEARRQFGDVEDARAYCRRIDQRKEKRMLRTEMFDELSQDVRFALRTLRKSPGFTIVAILTLALGIGANTAIFSVVRGILLRPLPFENPDRLVMVASTYAGARSTTSPANAYDWRDQNRSFASMAVLTGHSAVLTGNGSPERFRGFDVSADFFPLLGVKPARGRLGFSKEEAAWQGPKAVLVHESVWRTKFAGDTALVGSLITLDNEPYRVAGIVPADAAWPTGALLWFPFAYDPVELPHSRGAVYLSVVARLRPGATVESAGTDMRTIAAQLERQYPDDDEHTSAIVVPMREWITGSLERPLLVLLGGVVFVLLIACANVANLLLVRGASREGELAVRTALGARRGRLMRQLATESTLLAVTGGVAGLGLAIAGTRLLVRAAPPSIPRLNAIHVDGMVLGFALLATLLTGLIFGLMPARQLARADIVRALHEGGRGALRSGGGQRSRRALVLAEVALSVMLLAGAGLLIRSFDRLMSVDPGFRTDHAVSFAISLPDAKYSSPERQRTFMTEMMDRMHALPGVQSAGAGFGMPLTPFGFSFSFTVAGRAPVKPADQPVAEVRVATPDYLPTMEIPVVRGRGLTPADRAGGVNVLLITETAARRFFPGEDPIGRHVQLGWGFEGKNFEADIVGVVRDVKQSSLAAAALPQFWIPFDQRPMGSFSVILRSPRDPQAVVAEAGKAIHELDPDLALSQVKTLDQVVAESVAQPRFYMTLLAAFATVAIVLSAIGIYGVIAYLVGQRAREIGIRIALGASATTVVRMVLGEAIAMVAAGLAVGLAGAFAVNQFLTALLFEVKATDPLTYGAAAALLTVVALAASWAPALRATRVDPAVAMRAEA